MTRRELLEVVIAIGPFAAFVAPLNAQTAGVDARTIEYLSGGVRIEAYWAEPQIMPPIFCGDCAPLRTSRLPGVIVVHEDRGMDEHVRGVARRLALEGFAVLAPDLFFRLGANAYDAMEDLRQAFDYLARNPAVDQQKISVIGFGWGGSRSFTLATSLADLYRVVVFYGSTPKSGLGSIKAPVLAHYASRDPGVTADAARTEQEMARLGKPFHGYIYDNTDHGFFDDLDDPSHNAEAAALAWSRTLQFLRN